MALITCPECGKQISDQVSACPNCGYPFNNNPNRKTKREKDKTIKVLSVLVLVLVAVVTCLLLLSFDCNHEWSEASCAAPKTCLKCGEVQGLPLEHEWESATCNKPKTCTLCNTTEGLALKHVFSPATCEAPQTCTKCGKVQGMALEHEWKSATCTEPKTCILCQVTEGYSLGHSYTLDEFAKVRDGWSVSVNSDGTSRLEKVCTRCMEVTDRKDCASFESIVSQVVSNNAFIFTPSEFINSLAGKYENRTVILGVEASDGSTIISLLPIYHPGFDMNAQTSDLIEVSPYLVFADQKGSTLSTSKFDSVTCGSLIFAIQNPEDIHDYCNDLAVDTIVTCLSCDEATAFALLSLIDGALHYSDSTAVLCNNVNLYVQKNGSTIVILFVPA